MKDLGQTHLQGMMKHGDHNLLKRVRPFKKNRTKRFFISQMLLVLMNTRVRHEYWIVCNTHQDALTDGERKYLARIMRDLEALDERILTLQQRLQYK